LEIGHRVHIAGSRHIVLTVSSTQRPPEWTALTDRLICSTGT
jgi:hypothetical protein